MDDTKYGIQRRFLIIGRSMNSLLEDSRQQLLTKAKSGADYKGDKSKGRNRYARRTKSKISSNVKTYNRIDMNKFFKKDILDVTIKVDGETSGPEGYSVDISFSGVVDRLKTAIENNDGKLDFRIIVRSLIDCFNKDDVYIFCSCPDWHYRLNYWAGVHDLITDTSTKETRPSDITNPDDKFGPACKHVCLVLSNLQWIYKVAAVINNYTNYMQSHYKDAYAKVIYPALYGREYEEPIADLKDDEIGTDTRLVDIANKYGAERGRFKKGNTQGIRFAKETGEPIEDEED